MSICVFPSLQFLWRIFFFSRPVILFSQMKILLSCCHSTPDMALLLVDIQHTPNRPRHGRVDLLETVGTVLMYRRLTDPEFLCRLPHGCFCFYDIIRNFYCTLLDIILHAKTPAYIIFTMYAGGFGGMSVYVDSINYRYLTKKLFLFLRQILRQFFHHSSASRFFIFSISFPR